MRILTFARENYPVNYSTGFVLLHQSMALEDLGHEVHIFNLDKPSVHINYYLQAFDFDLIFLDLNFLRSQGLWQILNRYRQTEAVHVVGALYGFPAPSKSACEIVDFAITPWKGETVETLSKNLDLRYLPFAYNAQLHQRKPAAQTLGSVFVGDTTKERQEEADSYLAELHKERLVLCLGPAFERKQLDPFSLGHFYSNSRCLPNFHYSWEKGADNILNERFWQSARCGVPVNDFSCLMEEVFNRRLLDSFCFSDKDAWKDRVRRLSSGTETVDPGIIRKLDDALIGHSYHDRMKQLLEWLS